MAASGQAHPDMFDALHRLLAPAAVARATLLANHVIASEPAAIQRLLKHGGRRVRLRINDLPVWLPAFPELSFAVTRAGMLEWQPDNGAVDLELSVSAADVPGLAAGLLAGRQPPLTIEGDVALAADVAWLAENLRWDLAADLERFLPPALVHQLVLMGRVIRDGLQGVLSALGPGRTSARP